MSNEIQDLTTAELAALVQQMTQRIETLEQKVDNLIATRPIPEEDLFAIAAAAAAYMGYKGRVKAVNYASKTGWSSAGRRDRTANEVRGTMPGAY